MDYVFPLQPNAWQAMWDEMMQHHNLYDDNNDDDDDDDDFIDNPVEIERGERWMDKYIEGAPEFLEKIQRDVEAIDSGIWLVEFHKHIIVVATTSPNKSINLLNPVIPWCHSRPIHVNYIRATPKSYTFVRPLWLADTPSPV